MQKECEVEKIKSRDRGMALKQDFTVKSAMAEYGDPSRGLEAVRDPVSGENQAVPATNKSADFDRGDGDDEEGLIFESPSTEYGADTESDREYPVDVDSPCDQSQGTEPIDIIYREREGLQVREAWERKKGRVLVEGFVEETESLDCQIPRTFSRTKSLTDEDLDELKGCLDLGFGFNYDEIPELCNTLPALELCYSISQRFQDDQQKSSDGGMSDTSSNSSYAQSPIANWKISSPGDRPEQVKARLKFWAQAVACTVRLCS